MEPAWVSNLRAMAIKQLLCVGELKKWEEQQVARSYMGREKYLVCLGARRQSSDQPCIVS